MLYKTNESWQERGYEVVSARNHEVKSALEKKKHQRASPVGFSSRSLFHRSLNVLSFEKYKIKLIRVFLALMAMQGGIVHFHA